MNADKAPHLSTRKRIAFLMWDITSETADLLFNLSNVILIIGALAVLIGTYGAIKLASVREKFSNDRIATAEEQARQAQSDLQNLKAPRTLRPERQQYVADATAPFSGQHYRVAISQGADDGIAFWESLNVALKKAGWIYLPVGAPSVGNPPAAIPIAALPGVEIRFDPAEENELKSAALALGNALHADGMVVAVNRDRQSNPNEAERRAILIVIGVRVPP
jgi:hypothetical protein